MKKSQELLGLRLPLSSEKNKRGKLRLRAKKFPNPDDFDVIVLHEFYTYRYERSRLSPFRKPPPDNILHPDAFGLKYLGSLRKGDTPFKLVRRFKTPGQCSLERMVYKKYWGTFTSFVGEVYIYLRTQPNQL